MAVCEIVGWGLAVRQVLRQQAKSNLPYKCDLIFSIKYGQYESWSTVKMDSLCRIWASRTVPLWNNSWKQPPVNCHWLISRDLFCNLISSWKLSGNVVVHSRLCWTPLYWVYSINYLTVLYQNIVSSPYFTSLYKIIFISISIVIDLNHNAAAVNHTIFIFPICACTMRSSVYFLGHFFSK